MRKPLKDQLKIFGGNKRRSLEVIVRRIKNQRKSIFSMMVLRNLWELIDQFIDVEKAEQLDVERGIFHEKKQIENITKNYHWLINSIIELRKSIMSVGEGLIPLNMVLKHH